MKSSMISTTKSSSGKFIFLVLSLLIQESFAGCSPMENPSHSKRAQEKSETTISGVNTYSWTSSKLISDVQEMLNEPVTNHGWILITAKEGIRSVKRFESRENSVTGTHPNFIIGFITTTSTSTTFVDPLLHFTFDMDEGGIVPDQTGNGYTGIVNGATWTPNGLIEGAFVFDGDDEISIDSINLNSFSASVWIKQPSPQNSHEAVVVMKGKGIINRNNNVGIQVGSIAYIYDYIPPNDTWIHLVATWDGSTHQLYENGMGKNYWYVDAGWNIKSTIGGAGYQDEGFLGTIDDVLIFDKSLSQEQAIFLFNSGSTTTSTTSSTTTSTTSTTTVFTTSITTTTLKAPLLHYSFDNDEGEIVTDQSGNGYTGIVNGATWISNGLFEGAFHFDGIDDEININTINLNSFSVSSWIRQSSSQNSHEAVCVTGGKGIINRNNNVGIQMGSTAYIYDYTPPNDTWTHLVATWDGSTHELYENGVKQNYWYSDAGWHIRSTIGGAGYQDEKFFGEIDEILIFDISISQVQANFLYNFGLTTTSTTSTSTTLVPPVIVDINSDVTLWAIYTPTGIIVPMYSTNLNMIPAEWQSISIFSNLLANGTNMFVFDSPVTNGIPVFYELWQTP